MSVRFVIGRAGSGKTQHCLAAVQERLIESPVDGPRLLLLVPEQAALQMERALIADPRLGGSHRGEVMGFRRLADRVLAGFGSGTTQHSNQPVILTPNGRAMTLRLLLGQLSSELQYYRRVERLRGFIAQLADSVGELLDEAVSPDDLSEAATACGDDPIRARKLADLHLIYAAYLAHLGTFRLDPSQRLSVARDRLGDTPWLRGAEIWVDGFAGFTRQEMQLLAGLGACASQITVTAMADPDQAQRSPQTSAGLPFQSAELFAKPIRTFLRLRDELAGAGLEIVEPLFLRPATPPRFASAPALAQLERSVFADDAQKPIWRDETADDTGANDECHGEGNDRGPIELVRLSDRRTEVDYAVSRVCRWVRRRRDPLRYRDIALIVRDLEPYHDLLSAALNERGIPFFIDRRRPTAHHPLVELLRCLVLLVTESMSIEAVRLLLKTGLSGIDGPAADELENFILAHGIAGFGLWTGGDWEPVPPDARVGKLNEPPQEASPAEQERTQRVNATRRKMLRLLTEWLDFARSADRPDGRTWAVRLGSALERLAVPNRLAEWAADAEDDGDLDAAEEHRQIWRDATEFLNDLADALGDQPMTVQELADVLDAGLSQFTLGLAPPMLDQVLVGAIERSRHPEIRAAVILGFTDTAFPLAGSEGTILNDNDRTFLSEQGLVVGTPRRQRVLEERLLAYVALTRASEAVVLTYPAADEQGKPLRVSPFAQDVRSACPVLSDHAEEEPSQSRQMWPVMSSGDLAARLALELRTRPPQTDDDKNVRAEWNALYESARTDERLRAPLSRALSSLVYSNEAQLSADSIERLVASPFAASVSRLERFAACPFQHFADYGLKLRERQVCEQKDVDIGTVHHAILEDFVRRLVQDERSLGQLDESAVLDRLGDSAQRIGMRPPLAGAMSLARETYRARRNQEELAKVLSAQRQVSALGRFRQNGAEVAFGFEREGALPALEINTPKGRRVKLRGYIDRVDLAELADDMLGIVIDYKRTTGKKLDWGGVYHGLSLQLVAYLLALAAHGRTLAGRSVRPIGAFYVSLITDYQRLDHPGDYDEAKHGPLKRYRPRGLLNVGKMDALEAGYESGQAQAYNVQTKDGAIQYALRSDAASSDDFDALLEHTRYRLGELADGILDGDVAVAPYRLKRFSPCNWCVYRSVCRFEFESGSCRSLESVGRKDIFAKLQRRAGEGES